MCRAAAAQRFGPTESGRTPLEPQQSRMARGTWPTARPNVVGGTASGAGNLISGNLNVGIPANATSNNTIQGNRIGTNAAGTAATRTAPAAFSFSAVARPPVPTETRSVAPRWAQETSLGQHRPCGRHELPRSSPERARRDQGNRTLRCDRKLGHPQQWSSGKRHLNTQSWYLRNRDRLRWSRFENVIAYNAQDGVSIEGSPGTVANVIRENRIHSNGGIGIDLARKRCHRKRPRRPRHGPEQPPELPGDVNRDGRRVDVGTRDTLDTTSRDVSLSSSSPTRPATVDNGEGARFLGASASTTDGSVKQLHSGSPSNLRSGES